MLVRSYLGVVQRHFELVEVEPLAGFSWTEIVVVVTSREAE